MRRSFAALAALTLSSPITPIAAAQTAPDNVSSAAPIIRCPTQANMAIGTADGGPRQFIWNCRGQGGVPLAGVQTSAIVSLGTAPGAVRTVQVAVQTADGQGVCLGLNHIGVPRPDADGVTATIPMLMQYTFFTQEQLAEAAARGESYRPTIVGDPAQLPADAAECRERLTAPLIALTRAVVQGPRRAPQSEPVRAPGGDTI